MLINIKRRQGKRKNKNFHCWAAQLLYLTILFLRTCLFSEKKMLLIYQKKFRNFLIFYSKDFYTNSNYSVKQESCCLKLHEGGRMFS